MLELLPAVAKGFLRRRREEEFKAEEATKAPVEIKEETIVESDPITGPVISAPMCGRIVDIKVKKGQKVKKGDTVLVYEAMKMENEIFSPAAGSVTAVMVKKGDTVNSNDVLVTIG